MEDDDQDKPPPKEGPRWEHTEVNPNEKGVFVLRYNEFDIYAYKWGFVLRWGRDPYRRGVRYDRIKDADEERFQIPPHIQRAIMAIRAMEFGDFT